MLPSGIDAAASQRSVAVVDGAVGRSYTAMRRAPTPAAPGRALLDSTTSSGRGVRSTFATTGTDV